MIKFMAIFFLALCFGLDASAEKLKGAYIDKSGNVHIVALTGVDTRITNDGRGIRLSLSPDKEVVVWLLKEYISVENGTELAPSELTLYRNGKMRTIECQQIIRSYWFWKNGENVAIDCGGRHFAGRETLYDVRTLTVLDSFDQGDIPTERRPIWSESRTK